MTDETRGLRQGPPPRRESSADASESTADEPAVIGSNSIDSEATRRGSDVEKASERSQSQERKAPGASWHADQVHVIPKNNLPLVFAGIMMAMFLAALDQTIVSTANETIVQELSGSPADYGWIGTSYLLAACACCPLYGRLSDILGRKPVYFAGIFIFLLGSGLCGGAQNINWLIACRAVQGIGGGSLMQMSQIVISDIVPLEKRGAFSSVVGFTWGFAGAIGPLIGGALTTGPGWRWCFLINLPVGVVAFAILFFFLKLNPTNRGSFREFMATFDFLGLTLIIGGVICLLVGLEQGSANGWGEPASIALLVIGPVMLVSAGIVEARTSRPPIIPPRLFKTRTPAFLLIGVMCQAWAFIGQSYLQPLYYQILGSSALIAGVKTMPLSIGTAVISIMAGFLLNYLQRYKMIVIVSFALATLGTALLATLDESSNLAQQLLYLLIAALGEGPLFQTPMIAIQSSMPVKDMARATATLGFVRMLGGSMAISVDQAILQSEAKRRLVGVAWTPPLGVQVGAGSASIVQAIEPASLRQEVLHAYTRALSTSWIVAAPLLAVATVLMFFIKEYPLKRAVVKTGGKQKDVEKGEDAPEQAATEAEEAPRQSN